ncbi:MAG: hypothetical protein HC899_18440 [Leptolyngbyaceae cyanobacterium SM1_4_3]|nr:hypothetical protein [Leptolyngbyaceae cyanobacterium SM1_4_3]
MPAVFIFQFFQNYCWRSHSHHSLEDEFGIGEEGAIASILEASVNPALIDKRCS